MVMIGRVGLSVSGEGTIKAGENMGTAVLTLIYLALVSSVAYTLWGILLKTNDVSKISIFGFMTPVIGVILSALLLGESDTIGVKHILSLLLVVTGIVTVNVVDKS